MSTTCSHMDASATAPEHIATDLPCRNCGYNLRTVVRDGACPECGLPVATTLHEDWLADSPDGWCRRIERGARLIHWGVILALPLNYIGIAILTVGAWLVTAREPDRIEPLKDFHHRMIARGLLTLGLLIVFGAGVVFVVRAENLLRVDARNYDMALLVGHGLMFLGFLSLWRHVQILAMRLPNAPAARRMGKLRWCWIGAFAAVIAISAAGNIASWMYWQLRIHWRPFAPVLLSVGVVVLLWLWIVTWRAAAQFRRALTEGFTSSD